MTRTAAAIGAGIAPARASRAIVPRERIHVVGAAGAGASAAALLAARAGALVDGCDPGMPSPYTPALDAAGIRVASVHAASHLAGWTGQGARLAVTKALTAIEPDHPELVAARAQGVPVESWQQVIADVAVGRRLVAIAGTHGKSTTSGWLVHLLAAAGRDPAAFVGALMPAALTGGLPATARWGSGPDFVVEADEYADNYAPYRPEVAVLTSAEWDHPDVFADLDAVLASFEGWLRAAGAPVLVANVGDPGVARLVERLRGWPGRIERVAVTGAPGATLVARIADAAPDGTGVVLSGLDGGRLEVRLPTAGRHNVSNALCVAAAARVLGVDRERIAAGLASFPGIGRRLQLLGEAGGVRVYDDYGHHPTAIRETLAAIRQREPGRRVWAVYEPLTYHRTAALLDQFAAVLATADAVAIAEIWASRDPDTTITSAEALASAVRARRPGLVAEASGSCEATAVWLAGRVRPGDVVLTMGGGHSYRIGPALLEALGA